MKSRDYTEIRGRSWAELLLAAGAGATAMYLIDPSRGPRRRGLLRDKMTHASRKTARGLSTAARDLEHRAEGTWAVARGWRKRREKTDDEILIERVRAKLGRYASHPHAIEAYAIDGCVTLRGLILEREVDGLINALWRVPGVCALNNQLEVHESSHHIPSLQGGTRRTGEGFDVWQTSWSPATRMVVGLLGSVLAGYGAGRRDAAGCALCTAGFGFMARAASNLDTRRLVGVGAGRRAVDLQKTIHINAPVDVVFDFWTHYENFPRFMRNVVYVRPTAIEDQSRWTIKGPGGTEFSFDAVITELIPNRVLAWETVEGSAIGHAGRIQFDAEGETRTRLQIHFCYNPPGGAIGHALAALVGSDAKTKMDEDLARMKTLIETGHPPRDAAQPIGESPDAIM